MSVVAAFDPEEQTVAGSFSISLVNQGEAALPDLQLFLYPENYREDPDLDDILLERVYPGAFDPGGQDVSALRYRIDAGNWQQPSAAVRADGEVPILLITLQEPAAPGQRVELSGRFVTRIPRRYGSFGIYAGTATINGGLAPLLLARSASGQWLAQAPPPRIDRDLQLDLPAGWEGTLGGTILRPADPSHPSRSTAAGDRNWNLIPRAKTEETLQIIPSQDGGMRCLYGQPGGRWITASLRRKATVHNLPLSDGNTVSFVGKGQGTRQRRLLRTAVETSRALLDNKGLPVPDRGVTLVQAPLRRRLVESGDGVVLISDRFLEAAEPLWRYHDIHLARTILAQGVTATTASHEQPQIAPFVTEGIAWQLLPEYLALRWKHHLGARELLSQADFIPEVDALLSTPLFPFAEQIFDNPRVVDPLRADIGRFNRPLHGGRLLFLALADRVGALSLRTTIDRYLREAAGPTRPFHQLLEQRTGKIAAALFERRLAPLPRINYILEPVQRSRDPGGLHRTIVTVRREVLDGDDPREEVEVRVQRRRLGRKRWALLRWDGEGETHTWHLLTDEPTGVVEVDPFSKHMEADRDGLSLRGDNRRPKKLKVTGAAYLVALNATSFEIEAFARLEFKAKHDHNNRVKVYAYTDKETWLGIEAGYVRSFGPPRVGTWKRHSLSAYVGIDLLNARFRPTNAPLLLQAEFSYIYDSRVWAFSPTRGGRLKISVFAGKDLQLERDWERPFTSSTYFGAQIEGIRLIRLHPWHVLALRAKLGWVSGNVVHRNFTLGGNRDLRGIPEDAIVDPFRALAAAEWRHFFFRDLDLQLPLSRLRGLQGVLFAEYGVVGADLQNDAAWWREHAANRLSLGYGLRVYADWFGLLPGMLGVDVAWTPGAPPGRLPLPTATEHWPEIPLQVYFLVGQSF